MEEISPQYQFHFNKIFVIESLPIEENHIGKDLHDDSIRPRTWQFDFLKSEYIYVTSPNELFETLVIIKNQITEQAILPYIHFEMHGSVQGLHLQQGVVAWEEITTYLRYINIATRNNLMISFATCYGNEIHKLIDFSDRAPFFGFIAPIASVSIPTVKKGFNAFFTKLFTGEGFQNAYNALNNECIGNEHFVLDNCEDAFARPLKKQIAELQDPKLYFIYVLERANEMLEYKGIRNCYSIIELINQAKIVVDEALILLIYNLNFFLMNDLPSHSIDVKKL